MLASWLSNSDMNINKDYIIQSNSISSYYTKTNIGIFYEMKGKQEAIIKFLEIVLKSKKTYELLLISEENMDWLINDISYLQKWADLLKQVVSKGNTIKIIHTIQRNNNDLVKIVDKWMPLHLCKMVVSYYYPKYKEISSPKTMFIAPDLAAVTSLSLNNKNLNSTTYLIFNKQAIDSYVRNFNLYLCECEPLMNVVESNSYDKYKNNLNPFSSLGNVIIYRSFLPMFTIPPAIFDKLLTKTRLDDDSIEKIKSLYVESTNDFKKIINFSKVTLLIEENMLNNIQKGESIASIDDYHSNTQIAYTKDEITLHIRHLIKMLTKYDNINVYILNTFLNKMSMSVVAKENEYIFATNISNPQQHFSVIYKEKNITDAIYDYFSSTPDTITKKQRQKEYTIKKLRGK